MYRNIFRFISLLLNASNRENILQIEYMKYSVYKSSSVVKLSSEIIPKAFFCSLVKLYFGNCYKSGTIIYVLNQSLLRTFTLSLTFSFTLTCTHILIYTHLHSHSHPLFTNSLTHSLTHSLTYSLTHKLTHSSSNSLTHPLTHPTHPITHLFVAWY